MKHITIKDSDLRLNPRAEYARNVIERGHIPGNLSGANLKGKAKLYSDKYARQRNKAASAVRVATGGKVSDGYALIDSRWCRVWVDTETNEPVEIDIEG